MVLGRGSIPMIAAYKPITTAFDECAEALNPQPETVHFIARSLVTVSGKQLEEHGMELISTVVIWIVRQALTLKREPETLNPRHRTSPQKPNPPATNLLMEGVAWIQRCKYLQLIRKSTTHLRMNIGPYCIRTILGVETLAPALADRLSRRHSQRLHPKLRMRVWDGFKGSYRGRGL